jgi:hypothetical protein
LGDGKIIFGKNKIKAYSKYASGGRAGQNTWAN